MASVARTTVTDGRHPLIVHSHLRWDFVWQRPQQILSRFGRSRPVLYVEEPVFADDIVGGTLDVSQPTPGVYRVVPRLGGELRESYDDAAARVRTLLVSLLGEGGKLAGKFDDAVQWFYTPMPARTMIGALGECAVVYDCMDELAQFRYAPSDLGARERHLMAAADVVFTGGYQLYTSKAKHHDNVHFFGCGVDARHFGLARNPETVVAPELVDLPKPVLGYFGVVDERLDYELIARLADAFPTGSLAIVGPLAKVDPRELPQRPNIHWLGQRAYSDLPRYVKGFDVCLMPFALNEATEFINPTKTLEYMAGGKPIVSTAVPDVVRNFVPIVRVADSIERFIEEVRGALTPDPDRIEAGAACARGASWESIVASMDRLVVSAVRARKPWSAASEATQTRRAPTTTASGTASGNGSSAPKRSSSHGEGASSRA
jgi:glycosyltransferase involved in cell wall biosynthesis